MPNDPISGMLVTTNGPEAVSVWTFCSPEFSAGTNAVSRTECDVSPVPKVSSLAVGPGWFAADEDLLESNWSLLKWDLYIDGRSVDLDAFGTFDAQIALNNASAKLRSWNVVLEEPRTGAHTVRSVMSVSRSVTNGFHTIPAGRYELVATFNIAAGATAPISTSPIDGERLVPITATASR